MYNFCSLELLLSIRWL